MTTFTIDTENHIIVHASRKAARDTGAAVFSTEEQLADLIGPDNKRLVEIWNNLPGVKPVTKFANRKVATERIWKAIQGLGELPATAPAPEAQIGTLETERPLTDVPAAETGPEVTQTEPRQENQAGSEPAPVDPVEQTAAAQPVATVGAQAPQGAPAEAESSKETTPPKKALRTKKAAKPQETGGPPGDPPKQELLVVRAGLFAEHLQVLLAELADCHPAQRINLFLHLHRGLHAFLLSQGR